MSEVAGRYINDHSRKIFYLSEGEKKKNTLNLFLDPMNFECVEGISK